MINATFYKLTQTVHTSLFSVVSAELPAAADEGFNEALCGLIYCLSGGSAMQISQREDLASTSTPAVCSFHAATRSSTDKRQSGGFTASAASE